jgi:tungstate transport system substrate-binding protein
MDFMASGYGIDRRLIMHNDFVFVGPEGDPAKIQELKSPANVLRTIATAQAPFFSRGDDSGTHKKELAFWANSGNSPSPGEVWYVETGQGMGATLRIASEKGGYTLTDRATYLAQQGTLNLVVLVEGGPSLLNVYHSMVVNPDRWTEINQKGARDLSDFFISDEVQTMIGEFGKNRFGQPLFYPDADKTDADLGMGS